MNQRLTDLRRAQLDQLLSGDTNMAGGGLLKSVAKAAKAAKPTLKAVQKVLPAAERQVNLEKFLAPSAEKRRMYHGSKEPNIKEFKTRKDLTDESHMTGHYADERDAVFLAPEPEFTKNFSQMGYTDTHQAPTTYPVYVQVENPFDFDNPEHLQRVKDTYLDMYHNPDSEFYDPYLSPSERSTSQHLFKKRVDELPADVNNWPRIENKEFQNVLKDLGFDSFYTRERGTKNLGVYDPNRIKSSIGNRGTYDITDPDINKAGGGLLKSVVKAAQKVLPAVEREANLAKFLAESKTPMRLYHATTATEGGKGTEAIRRIKPSKEGSLGSGVYLTPSSAHASGYSGIPNDEALNMMLSDPRNQDFGLKALNQRNSGDVLPSQQGGNMLPVHAQIRNPLIIEGQPGRYSDPMIEALTKLGMDEDKATRMVERAYDQKGYIGKEVESRARAAGYDGLAQYRNGELSEVVAFDPNTVKSAIGNRGTYDTNEPDLNKAGGGLLKAVVKAAEVAKPAAKAVEAASQLGLGIKKGLGWAGSKTPDTNKLAKNAKKFIYHSDIAPNVNELHHGIEPQQGGPWVKEVAHGAVDNVDEFLENTTPLAWFSDDPTWVKIKVSRHLNKPLNELTEDDIRKYGHLAIINKKDSSLENIWRVGEEGLSNGEYSKVQTLKGESIPAHQTDLYQNDYQGNKEPFGVERNEWVSTQPVEPFVQLTGDDLIDFLKKSGNFKDGGLVHLAGGGDPRKRGLFPKMSTQAIVDSPGFDPEVPSDLSRAYARRMAEKDAYGRSMADQKLTPANRAVAGAEATGMIGSALFEGVQQLPKLLDGEEAYTKAVGEGMYQPRFQPEKAAEYAGNVGDFLEKLETDYKMPALMPELLPFIGAAEAAKQQSKRAVKQGALTAASRMDAGPKAGSMAAQRGAVKLGGGNWVDTEVKRRLSNLKQDDSYAESFVKSVKEDLAGYEGQPQYADDADRMRRDLAHMEQTNAFNKWVDTKAGSYVRNQMATPDDPVVKMLDVRAAKIEADYQAGQKRLAKLDERIAQAPTSTQEEQNTLANLKRTRSQRAAEIESDRELAMNSMLPGGEDFHGYEINTNDIGYYRKKYGFPEEGYAKSLPGQAWEAAVDSSTHINSASKFQGQAENIAALKAASTEYGQYVNVELPNKFRAYLDRGSFSENDKQALMQKTPKTTMVDILGDREKFQALAKASDDASSQFSMAAFDMAEENPYLANLPPETPVYNALGIQDLGIDHIIDVLKDDVATGKLKLEDLNKITMDQAVKRAAEYDFEMAKKARDAVATSRASMPVYKEYPEGYKWVQLTKPGEFNAESNAMGHSVRGYEPEKGHPDWTPKSGDSGRSDYGHGGWEAIKSGEAKVYSLVDPSGNSHSTIEVKFNKPETWMDAAKEVSPEKITEYWNEFNDLKKADPSLKDPIAANKKLIEFFKSKGIEGNQTITQIKGKVNKRPSEKYDPYTQDFVKSGNWSEVEDLRNTGLRATSDAFNETEQAFLKSKGVDLNTYIADDEIARYQELFKRTPVMGKYITSDALPEEGMAGGGLLSKIGKAAKAARAAEELVPAAGRMKFADQPRGGLNVIKETGGNWLGGSVEKGLKNLKSKGTTEADREWLINHAQQNPEIAQIGLDFIPKNEAINKWIDRNLTNYIKKQMATPDDPVRKLAEEGITHFPIAEDPTYWAIKGESSRKEAGGNLMSKSDLAQQWENRSDAVIQPVSVRTIKKVKDSNGPGAHMYESWMDKADPNTKLHMAGSNFDARDLGFDHIVDVLKQDVAEGRIRPEQLNKVSMEQAVRRTYEYDQEMAKKMRETQAKVTEGMPVHKDYGDKGYKWIELTKPEGSLPKNWKPSAAIDYYYDDAENFQRHPGEKILEDALKYEGDAMGHCVGGYCPDVLEGRSRIYSLRDAKGEPHVTVEVKPNKTILNSREIPDEVAEQLNAEGKRLGNEQSDASGYSLYGDERDIQVRTAIQRLKDDWAYSNPVVTQKITQIKGKGNRAPKEEYLPFVQDFVRSGKWSDVGDIQHTGMRATNNIFNQNELQSLRDAGETDIPHILTGEEIQRLSNLIVPEGKRLKYDAKGNIIGNDEGMAGGGSVGLRNALNNLLRTDKPEAHMALGGATNVAKAAAKAAKAAYSPKVLNSTIEKFVAKIAADNPKLSEEDVLKKATKQATSKLEWERVQKPELEKTYGPLVKTPYSKTNVNKMQNTAEVVAERKRKANEFLDQPTEPWTPPAPELQAFDRSSIKDALEGFPGVEQTAFPRDIPTRASTSHVDELYADPENRALIEKQIKRGLPLGGETFYASLYPVKQAVLEAGMPAEKFDRWIHSLAPASARNSIMNEMASGQFLRDMNARGIPLTEENVAREMAVYKEKFGIGLPLMPLHREGVAKVIEGGQDLREMSKANIPTNYKIPTYGSQKAGDFANSVVLDVHEAGGQTQGSRFHPYFNEQGGFGNTEYNAGEQGLLGIAGDLGIPGGMAQAGRWFGGGELTGLRSPRGDALDLLEKQVAYTLSKKGIQPNPANVRAEVLRQIETGEGDLLPWYRKEGMPDVRQTGLQRKEGGEVTMESGLTHCKTKKVKRHGNTVPH